MKKQKQLRYLTTTGLLAALITIFTAYILHIPVGMNGGYIHIGDSIIYIAAALLPAPYAMVAGAIGGGLADLLTAPLWAPATVIIKMLIVLPFTSKKSKLLPFRNVIAPFISFVISATGYYIANWVIFGEKTAILTSFSGSFIQSGSSAVIFIALAIALDKAGVKSLLFSDSSSHKWKGKEGEVHG